MLKVYLIKLTPFYFYCYFCEVNFLMWYYYVSSLQQRIEQFYEHDPFLSQPQPSNVCTPIVTIFLMWYFYVSSLQQRIEQFYEHDPFLSQPQPSNPWITEDITHWQLLSEG